METSHVTSILSSYWLESAKYWIVDVQDTAHYRNVKLNLVREFWVKRFMTNCPTDLTLDLIMNVYCAGAHF